MFFQAAGSINILQIVKGEKVEGRWNRHTDPMSLRSMTEIKHWTVMKLEGQQGQVQIL